MKLKLLVAIMAVACAAQAKGPRFYEKGTLTQMNSVECGYEEKGAAGIGGILGVTDSQHSKTRQMLCQEYLLRSDRTEYRIRPKEEKHPALLPVGQDAEFRLTKDRMRLRVPELDTREREYIVVSISPRTDVAISKRADSGTASH